MTFNAGHTYTDRARTAGSVLAHLATHHPHDSLAEWRARILAGEVEVDGRQAGPDDPLSPGQTVAWHRPPWDEPDVDLAVALLYEDEALLAVRKPRGLPTLPGGGFLAHTLLARVRARYPEARPMHRLGRGTSGLVLFARTADAAARLQADWRDHAIRKTYRALASGACPQAAFRVEAPIGPVPHPRLGTLHAASPEGRPAASEVRVLALREDGTLAEVDIETGRPHQIRIHLAWAGHPLVGDPLYGPGGLPLPDGAAVPGDGGYWLHAFRLDLRHPLDGRPLHLEAPPPPRLALPSEAPWPGLPEFNNYL
ncbi:RluA family pseudouridine synthase [Mesoterricola sediminis]|uniref:Pseudouridine synthase n=1 Tax=Mesoterricola sediminis TaxID=2927980 RepID=A0AA48GSZ0_9BACT|nr:RluA family pseudouridine synthase [Mesoterricola sediminis]BDU75614.1 RNA pseudouridine synthase [Mesoterricola sediminis]